MRHPTPARLARRDVLLREMEADVIASPDERSAIPARGREWSLGLKPRDFFAAWLVDQAAVDGLRIDRLQRVQRRRRTRSSIRAAFFWDDDRRIEAEHLGANLGADPAAVKFSLEQTPQGCDWLLIRWSLLGRQAARPEGWKDDHRKLALDLLGTPADLRLLDPSLSTADPLVLIARETARLQAIKDGAVGDLDDFDRANAEADLVEDRSPEGRQIARELTALHYRLRWTHGQLKNPIPGHIPAIDFLDSCFPVPQPEPLAPVTIQPQPQPEPEPEPQAQIEPIPDPQEDQDEEAADILPLAPPLPKPAPSRRHRRANIARARKADRHPNYCPS